MEYPLISIVLPSHNGSRYIGDAIDSCLAQTYRRLELIVVDDGSTDDTLGQVAERTDPRIRIVRHGANLGLPAALNTGFAHAGGELLTWTSDDNYYRPTALERMATFLVQHPDVDFVYTDYLEIDATGAPIRRVAANGLDAIDAIVGGEFVTPCFLYRRRVHEALGPYAEDMALAEDYDYWLRASISFRMAPLHEDLYCYRRHSHSLSSRHTWPAVRAVAQRSLRRHLRALPWMDRERKAWVCMNWAREARLQGELGSMLAYLGLSVRYAPLWAVRYVVTRLWEWSARRLPARLPRAG